jgi:EpsI family protein
MLITLPNIQIEVARACSGVNYLVAVVALGLPLAYLHLQGIWRRVALLVSAVVVAALSNGLRVALIGCLAYLEVGSPLHGPFHMLHGLFVAGIGYVALFAGLRVLRSPQSAAASRAADKPVERSTSAPTSVAARSALAAVAVVVFGLVGVNAFVPSSRPVELPGGLTGFPARLGDWTALGTLPRTEDGPWTWFQPDAELRREYRNARGAVVHLYIGYFASQSQGREIVNHRIGSVQSSSTRVRVGDSSRGFEANLTTRARDQRELLFWYDVGSGAETNQYAVKARTMLNAMWRGRTNGSVVVIGTDLDAGRSSGLLQEFAPMVAQALDQYRSSAMLAAREIR